jgi:hypothetical protein
VRRNTQQQNSNLDVVGDAAADIKRLAYVSTRPSMWEHLWRANHPADSAKLCALQSGSSWFAPSNACALLPN